MSSGLLTSAVSGGLGSVAMGVISLVLFWIQNRSNRNRDVVAWQERVDEIHKELSQLYEKQIKYLQEQIVAKDAQIRRLTRRENNNSHD